MRRPELPVTTPAALTDLCRHAWDRLSGNRPSFAQIAEKLRGSMALSPTGGLWRSQRRTMNAAALQEEMNKQRQLLHKVFPPRVADALMEGRSVEPQEIECVTIFFSDIVGFTDISAALQPQEVMSMLDRLYTSFDAVTSRHRLFKVETIGDAARTRSPGSPWGAAPRTSRGSEPGTVRLPSSVPLSPLPPSALRSTWCAAT